MNIQKSLIIGMGKTGHSFAGYLSANDMCFDFADTRSEPPGLDEFRSTYTNSVFHLGELDDQILDQYQQLLLSPGFDIRHPFIQQAKRNKIEIKGDIDLFIAEVDAKIIGITGSNGKSTLTELITFALQHLSYKAVSGGNIGTAALTLLNEDRQDIYVLELSSFQLDISAGLKLDAAVVLNISEDHMDRYDSFLDYVHSKQSIYADADKKVINIDDPYSIDPAIEKNAITFSILDAKADFYFAKQEATFYYAGKPLIRADEFALQGLHNYQNILAALAIAKAVGVDIVAFAQAAKNYKGLPHRCELVSVLNGVSWVNDSKATNVGATLAAMNSFPQPLHIIMGGQSKGVDFTEFAQNIPKHIKSIILLGEDAVFIQSFIANKVQTYLVKDMYAAICQAQKNSMSGDIVLLSPACASFDMYSGYEARGDDFRKRVMEMAA